ncbi:SNPC4 protein, partial [Heliornis fulica]|nr:SNPC4 protein [Heliornis fulica]
PAGLDLNAEREKIRREIEELERSLEPGVTSIDVSDSSLSSDAGTTGARALQPPAVPRSRAELPLWSLTEDDNGDDDDDDDDEVEHSLPQDPETCLQMNHVYQEVIQEKIEEVELLIAQNREEQKEILSELGRAKVPKAGDGRNLPANLFLGHFMKPYFKDKTTGIGPPANEDTKEKAAQGIKSFEQLVSIKWKSREKTLLRNAVVSDRLQRLLQPKLLKLSYWNQKLEKVKTEMEKQILEKQIKEVEQEIEAINQLPESDLIGNRFDEHDWEKISNIHFDGQRSPEELSKFWQNCEHPSINKKEWTEEEIERLKKIAAKHSYVDWQSIAQELGTNRTAFQCLQKYQIYNKDLKRKEWTKAEDQMLLELVQEMRVGSHIPYKKIAYYMEGRNSTQLIYRWTKSVDPNLKKGFWTPEEDALLLAAVKKYGARDWYKIRTEVPGRSDAQCRDRYLKALHCDVKKGRWSLEEEEQLIELVQKHGLGHWSKIASELPHRTGSQCLSKWKLMIGSKKKRYRQTKHRHVEESSSSSESSSEDIELDLSDTSEEEEEETPVKEQCPFPSMDLWIPTQTSTQDSNKGRSQTPSLSSPLSADATARSREVLSVPCPENKAGVASKPSELNTLLCGMACPHSTDTVVRDPAEVMTSGKQVLQVTLEDVRRVLRNNTCFQRKLVSASSGLSALVIGLARVPGVGSCPSQDPQGLPNIPEKTYRQERERLRRMNLDRKLLMAVTPWVGNVLLPCSLNTGKVAFHRTKAESIQEKIKSVSLTSTPLFTLLIQLFQIDTNGCMKIIRERRLRQSELLRADARRPQQVLHVVSFENTVQSFLLFKLYFLSSVGNSSQPCPQRNSQRGIPRKAVGKPVAVKARETSAAVPEGSAPAAQGASPAQVQRQKPKTVSELLREKRLRESRAKKAVQKTVYVAPQMLVSGPLIIQHPPQQILPSEQAGSKVSAAGYTNSQVQCVPAPLQSNKEQKEQALEGSLEGGGIPGTNPAAAEKAPNQGGCNGQVLAGSSASVVLQNQAFVPHQITVVPVGIESGTNKLSLSTPVACELNSNGPQQRPVSLLPALVTSQTSSPLIPNSILPFTWVVTPQALLPTAVQAVVGVPSGMPAAVLSSHCQTTGTSSGSVLSLGVPPAPAGASTPHLSSAETKAPSARVAGGEPSGRTTDHSGTLPPVASASPGCSVSSVSSAGPACPGGFSKASSSSAAQTVPPADAAAPDTVGLPQTQLPASTQGANSPVPQNNVPRTSDNFAAQALKNRPLASKPVTTQPADSPSQPTTSSAEKNLLDLSLISLEDEGLVKEWLSGKQGVRVPLLQTRLPYLPPFLCNIKTLSKLLLQKAALEEQVACLLSPGASQDEGTGVDLHAVRELVQQKLGNNPAYLLLKARFLAAFTLPAVLATLPPPKVTTTLSASRKQYEESDEEEGQSEEVCEE